MPMRVGIVGAGFVGLTTAYRLVQQGVEVVVFEAEDKVGGLASGFSEPGWDWPLERFYHHIFTNDEAVIQLAREVDWPPIFFRPNTSIFFRGQAYPFDTPLNLLRFPHLPLTTKLRMGAMLGFMKLSPFWKPLEHISANKLLSQTMGARGYETIWKPFLTGKFGTRADEINAAWFWARIQKRTARLGYFNQGFQGLADRLYKRIVELGGTVNLSRPVSTIRTRKNRLFVSSLEGMEEFDRVLVTLNIPLFLKMVSGLPQSYQLKLRSLQTLDALTVIIVLRKRFMKKVYWLNVISPLQPFLVVVEHTNMIDSMNYGGNHIVYLGAYLPYDHRYLTFPKKKLIKLALQQLGNISNTFNKEDVLKTFVFRGHKAQPIMPINYSALCPTMETPIDNLFMANMSLVYPWDREVNYAVEWGEKAAVHILK